MDPEPAQATLGIVLRFDRPYSESMLTAMEEEAGTILRPSGLTIQWRLFQDAVGKPFDYPLLVVRFRGQCEIQAGLGDGDSESPLAATHLFDGVPILHADLYCDRVWNLVGPQINSSPLSAVMMGRALGRVLVHEVYHMAGRTRGHGKDGVTKAVLTPWDLVGGSLRLQRSESELIMNRLLDPFAPFEHQKPER